MLIDDVKIVVIYTSDVVITSTFASGSKETFNCIALESTVYQLINMCCSDIIGYLSLSQLWIVHEPSLHDLKVYDVVTRKQYDIY